MMMAMKIEQKALLPEEERTDPPPKRFVETLAARQGRGLTPRRAPRGTRHSTF